MNSVTDPAHLDVLRRAKAATHIIRSLAKFDIFFRFVDSIVQFIFCPTYYIPRQGVIQLELIHMGRQQVGYQ